MKPVFAPLVVTALLHSTPIAGVAAQTSTLTIMANVPADTTSTVYVTGNQKIIGNWKAAGLAMQGRGTNRAVTIEVENGTTVKFKVTLGDWDHEALLADGSTPPDTAVMVAGDTTCTVSVSAFGTVKHEWKDTLNQAGIIGEMRRHLNFPSKTLGHPRHILVRLPEDYASSGKCYGVLYMHDGQNLFDPRTSASGVAWGIDKVISRLSKAGKMDDLIIVGIFNSPEREYDYATREGREKYGRFLVEELKPFIDKQYRTLPDAAHTGLMGSSYGGRISLYLGWSHSDVFGKAACLSNAIRTGYDQVDDILGDIERSGDYPKTVRLYFDYGTIEEGPQDDSYPILNQRLAADLTRWGWKSGKDFMLYVAKGGSHTERSWHERLDMPLLFLFGKQE
jgi:predicted alpha/beta superfamily hydrolase